MQSFVEIKESLSNISDNAKVKLKKVASTVGVTSSNENDSVELDPLEELAEFCPKLTYQQRILGFLSSYGTGYVVTLGAFGFFIELCEGHPLHFVTMYSTGNILALLSSTFLCGPKRQFKNMFHENRLWTTIIYLSSLFITLIFCVIPDIPKAMRLIILILLLFLQLFSSLWYSLSYIPFARRAVLRWLTNISDFS